jgi:hypothetical protein
MRRSLYVPEFVDGRTFSEFRRKLLNTYQTIALLLLNTFLLFVLINVGLLVFFSIKDIHAPDKPDNPIAAKYGASAVRQVYGGSDPSKVEKLLQETWSRGYVYEAYTQFKESPFAGEYVNVSEQGFRLSKEQGPWPPAPAYLNVFVFGGSTTFGYGVSDDQTVPSWLQHFLSERLRSPVRVYNFGRGWYYSTQERILYEQLLLSGFVPDIAVFIDGVNDFYYYSSDEPRFTERMQNVVDGDWPNAKPLEWVYISELPMMRFAQAVNRRLRALFMTTQDGNGSPESHTADLFPSLYDDRPVLEGVIRRYLNNKKMIEMISTAFNVEPVFVWQPVPTYGYDLRDYPFQKGGFGNHTYSRFGYPLMAQQKDRMGDNFLWCADVQQGMDSPLYVDKLHYSPVLSRAFAERIAALMVERGLISSIQVKDTSDDNIKVSAVDLKSSKYGSMS